MTGRRGRRDAAVLAILLLLYLGLALTDIDLPGLWYDEAHEALLGAELALGLPPWYSSDWALRLAGREWPLRSFHPYDFTALPIYAAAAAFRALGVGVIALRACSAACGAAIVAMSYALARRWLGREAAAAGGLLLAVNPAFVVYSRVSFYAVELPLAAFGLAALLLADEWRRRRSTAALCGAALVLGLSTSLSTKSLALLLAVPAALALRAPGCPRPSRRQAWAAAAAFAAGAANWLAFNLSHPGGGVWGRLILALLPGGADADNADVLGGAAVRAGQLLRLLDGRTPLSLAGPAESLDVLLPWACAAACAAAAWRLARGRDGERPLAALLVLPGVILAATVFSPGGRDAQHPLAAWPYPLLLVGAALARLAEALSARWGPVRGRAAAGALTLLLAASSARADRAFFSVLRRTGGAGLWSDAVYGLADHLDRVRPSRTLHLHWGSSRSVYVLTQGRVRPYLSTDFWRYVHSRAGVRAVLRDPRARFVAVAEDMEGIVGHPQWIPTLGKIARVLGRRLELEREFRDREGRVIFKVYRTEPG